MYSIGHSEVNEGTEYIPFLVLGLLIVVLFFPTSPSKTWEGGVCFLPP